MTYHIYFRIPAYIITIAMHTWNIVVMMNSFHGEPMKNEYVRHFSEMQSFFFTCWTFTFQTIYAALALWTDVLTLKKSKSVDYKLPNLLVNCRDAMFSILVWPSTVVVFSMFWSFFYYDRGLFFPQDIDLVISSTSNHIMHTFIMPVALWEVIFRRRTEPIHHTLELMGLWLYSAVYFSVIFAVYAIKGVWVYPIFGILRGSILFYLLFASIVAALPFIYYAQWTLNKIAWTPQDNLKKIY